MELLTQKPEKSPKFIYRGTPIPPEIRPIWKISLIALILFKLCRAEKASPKKILVVCSLVSSHKKMKLLVEDPTLNESQIEVRLDPSVDRAIDIGLGEKLFKLDELKNIQLTERGANFSRRIMADSELFLEEKCFMSNFNKNFFSDSFINRLLEGRS